MSMRRAVGGVLGVWLAWHGVVSAAVAAGPAGVGSRRPNVIVFLVDDMGWMDCGAYGSKFYETPNGSGLISDNGLGLLSDNGLGLIAK